MAQDRKLRVVQWAPGDTGGRTLRNIVEHPRMELVGVLAYSESKIGKDAGELVGLPPVGVKVTHDIEAIIATRADCCVYTPRALINVEEICRILEAGINIVTTRVDFHNPNRLKPEIRQPIEEACRRGNSSLHSTGSSPGFATEVLPLAALMMQRRLDQLIIDEFSEIAGRDSPRLHFDVLGFGKPLSEFDGETFGNGAMDIALIGTYYFNSFSLIADAMGLPMDDFTVKAEVAATRGRLPIACGVLEAGTAAGLRISTTGLRRGKPLFLMRTHWFCGNDLDADWELRPDGWRVQVKGDAPLDIGITLPIPENMHFEVTPGYTAHPAVNAVPAVVAARPGIVTSLDLPHIVPVLGDA